MATVSDRGRTRKERIAGDAFGWQMREFARVQQQLAEAIEAAVDQAQVELLRQELERRNVHVLAGHSFDRPLGDMKSGTARVASTREEVEFAVDLPDESAMPSYMADAVRMIEAGLVGGISPGFRVPPASAVANAEAFEPEPGNPGVQVRVINQAVLHGAFDCGRGPRTAIRRSMCARKTSSGPCEGAGGCGFDVLDQNDRPGRRADRPDRGR